MRTSDTNIVDDEGYILVPRREKNVVKGIKCGECGMKFDHDKCYGFVCGNSKCPIQLRTTL